MTVQSWIASWSARDAVRSVLGLEGDRDPDGPHTTIPDDPRVFERNWRLNRGAQVAPRPFVPIEGALPKPYEGSRWKWRPHPVHAFYVERFLNLAAAHQIPVYWVLTPAMSAWLDRNDEVGTIGAYRRFVRDQVARFPGLIVLDAQGVGWDRSAFRDPIHLNRDGAVRLTLSVAESILRCTDRSSDGSRWLKLDGNADQSSNRFQDLLEDLDQSRAAVNQRESGSGPKGGIQVMDNGSPKKRPSLAVGRAARVFRPVTRRAQDRRATGARRPPERTTDPSISFAPACIGLARPGNMRSSPTSWNAMSRDVGWGT